MSHPTGEIGKYKKAEGIWKEGRGEGREGGRARYLPTCSHSYCLPLTILSSLLLSLPPSLAIVYAYGDKNEAERMWSELNGQAQYKYRDEDFLRNKLRWPQRMIDTLREFKGLYTSRV